MSSPADAWLFLGRLHPLLVHLPIGLLVLLSLLEWLARFPRFKAANQGAGFVLALAVPAAIFSVICGWLLSAAGGYDPHLLKWHKWTAIGTAAACALAGLLYLVDLKKAYRGCLVLTLLALVVASHFGGSLTHGSDYLVQYAPASLRNLFGIRATPTATPLPAKSPADAAWFADVVLPVFQQDCTQCHGKEKSAGGFRADSYVALQKGGKSGPSLVPGHADQSEAIKRMLLPLTDKKHMPPDGKPQPSADQLAVIQWWMNAGAPQSKKLAELKPPLKLRHFVESQFAVATVDTPSVPPKPREQVLAAAENLSGSLGIALETLSEKEPWLQCDASIAGLGFDDAALAKLAPLAANIRWLDLSGTRVTDAGLQQVAAMPNLKRLHLERTAITDAGLGKLSGLASLEYLNLYGTGISDAGVAKLETLPKLKHLFLWATKVTPAGAKAFAEAHTDKDQIQEWEEEIDQLKARIQNSQVSIEMGTVALSTPATNAAPMNADCPVSGKPTNPAKVVTYEGKVVAFCCDDCKAEFQKEPKRFLSKLGLTAKNTEGPAPKAR